MQNMLSEVLDIVRPLLNQLLVNIGGDQGEIWLSELKKFLRKEPTWTDHKVRTRLRHNTTIKLPAAPPCSPDEFFQTKQRLFVSSDFRNRIVAATESCGETPGIMIKISDLEKSSNDAQIQSELPNEYIFEDPDVFCPHLAQLIEDQKNGEDGILLNNGLANLFYVRGVRSVVFSVCVIWHAGRR